MAEHTTEPLSASEARELIRGKLSHYFGTTPEEATDEQIYKAIVLMLRDRLTEARRNFSERAAVQGKKRVFYLCMEFLMGRSLKNTLFNFGLTDAVEQALEDFGIRPARIYDMEPDAGLGNGGLGRLAACFLDALATGEYPAMGYSIRYEYGIFRQKLVDGWQTELPDFWLPGGEVWLNPHPEEAAEVRFDGHIRDWWDGAYHHVEHENYTPVKAIPYDLMVAGEGGAGVSLLRLWKAEAPGLDMKLFNEGNYLHAMEQDAMAEVISKVLYPADNHPEGKSLRLRQQYFLVSASVQDIVRRHFTRFGSLDSLPDEAAIHINDTHPVLAIPELMRIMLDECGYDWDTAADITARTFAYTNHTVMSEALECWSVELFRERLPRIFQIVTEIDNRRRKQVWDMTRDAGLVERTAIISGGAVRMANLAVACCHSVNGVSRLHSEILKKTVFSDFYRLTPQKFTNVTNGIAHRRWLCQANPALSSLITEKIGDGFIRNANELSRLTGLSGDREFLSELALIKRQNKVRLSDYLVTQGERPLDPDSIFDVQVKRLHEYKRQHLNALHILSEYLWLKANPNAEYTPKTYLFGAKAAPGYFMAKQIIQMICEISKMIENDPAVRDRLRVVYVEDYRVTLAELLIPSADISEQISLAGTEASGTGNMKLMLNGAVTLGTEDGANVEIHEAVGDENILIFGMKTDEVASLRAMGYNPQQYYHNNPVLRDSLNLLMSGINGHTFDAVSNSLMNTDPYMVLADFEDYCQIQKKATAVYNQSERWRKMSLMNIACAGRFSADRAIAEYARNIWNATPVE